MDPARFGELVRRLEERARLHPRLYRAQVAAVAALGYAYVLGVLLLVVAILLGLGYLITHAGGAAIALKLLIPLVGFGFVLLRALWIRVPDLEGIPLPPEQYRTLADVIERIRARVGAPRFRRVLLDGDFNASVAQRPRFGLLGPSVSDLVLGLPLLQALSPAEVEAVLAHELGHVSREHGRFGHWIYRIRMTWSHLAHLVGSGGGAGTELLLGRFLSWYAPFFNAYSFVLARLDEYEADSTAVRLAGAAAFSSGLVRLSVLGRYHGERYWEGVSSRLMAGGELPNPHLEFAQALAQRPDSADLQRWLEEALRRPTDDGDTHPSLSDRLRAVGITAPPSVPAPPPKSAADAWLGPSVDALARQLDARWRSVVEPQVAARRAELETVERRLAEIEAGAASEVDQLWERVQLLEQLRRTPEALGAAAAILRTMPHHPQALFVVGRERLAAEDGRGVALLERAAGLLPTAAPAAYGLIFEYHWRNGRRAEAEAARARSHEAGTRLERAARERASLRERPVLVPHGLPHEHLERLQAAVQAIPGVRHVYLTRRVVVESPEIPCYMVGIVPAAARWWQFHRQVDGVRLRDAVMAAASWPESTYFVVREGEHRRLVRRMKRVPGSRLGTPPEVAPPMAATTLEAMRSSLIRRRARRRRLRLAGATGLAGVLALGVWGYTSREKAIATTPIRQLNVAQLADRLRGARGHGVVLVLYSPRISHAELVLALRQWAVPRSRSGVELLALTVGERRDAQAFFRYTPERGRGLVHLAPIWLEPWRSGALDSTLGELGVRVGKTWKVPLVAVIDSAGTVVAQWQGTFSPAEVIAAAERSRGGHSVPGAPAPTAAR